MSKIVIISGATSSGKSQLAVDFALRIKDKQKSVIINADSLQIYQGLPILSAQPTKEEQQLVSHRLYSRLLPNQNSSVAIWLGFVKEEIKNAIENKELPIIVGGTGMYISSLMEGISPVPEIDPEIRKESTEYFEQNGSEDLQEKLISLGEKKIIDRQRLIRAYEVYLQTGKTIAYFQSHPKEKPLKNAEFIHLNLDIPREKLYENCNSRFTRMLDQGALAEVKDLREKIKEDNPPISKTLGYAEICQYLDEEILKEEVENIVSQKTRNYAKRQLTWFRNQTPNKQVCTNSGDAIKYLINEIC